MENSEGEMVVLNEEALNLAVKRLVALEEPEYNAVNLVNGELRLERGPTGLLAWLDPISTPIRPDTLRYIQTLLTQLMDTERRVELELLRPGLLKLELLARDEEFTHFLLAELGLQVKDSNSDSYGDILLGQYVPQAYYSLRQLRRKWWRRARYQLRDWVVDADHPWRNLKFRFVLKGIRDFSSREFRSTLSTLEALDADDLSPVEVSLRGALRALFFSDRYVQARDQHLEFLLHLRDAMDHYRDLTEEQRKEAGFQEVLVNLCYARFAGVHLYQFGDRLVNFLLGVGAGAKTSVRDLDFPSQYRYLDEAPERLKLSELPWDHSRLRGHVGIEFDPHLMGVTPYTQYCLHAQTEEGESREIRCFRMATPFMEDREGSVELTPEMEGMLEYYRLNDKKHLAVYLGDVEHQRRPRWQAWEAWSDRYPENLVVVALGQDSNLARHRGEIFGTDVMEAATYKAALKQAVLYGEEGYRFPVRWREDPSFHDRVDAIVEGVHRHLFRNPSGPRPRFNTYDRNLFKECVDALLLHYLLMEKVQADSYHLSAGASINRVTKSSTLLLRVLSILSGQEPTFRSVADVYAHLPSVLVKPQALHFSRRLQLIQASRFLEEESVAWDFLRIPFRGKNSWTLKDIQVRAVAYQDLYPNPETAETLLEGELLDHREDLKRMLDGGEDVWSRVPLDDDDRRLIAEL